jgi:hypothetical protein
MFRITTLALGLATLVACGRADLTGSWSGEIACDEGVLDIEFDLVEDDRDAFSGDTEASMALDQVIDTQFGPADVGIAVDLQGEIEATTDGPGEQELDIDVEFQDIACDVSLLGQSTELTCADVQLTVDDLEFDGSELTVTWDGEDTLTVADGDCSGDITR